MEFWYVGVEAVLDYNYSIYSLKTYIERSVSWNGKWYSIDKADNKEFSYVG